MTRRCQLCPAYVRRSNSSGLCARCLRNGEALAARRALATIASAARFIIRSREPSMDRIKQSVCARYDLPALAMTGPQRRRAHARPRQLAMYLAKRLTHKSLGQIGRAFGDRDHTTVMHAYRHVEKLCASDVAISADVRALLAELSADQAIEAQSITRKTVDASTSAPSDFTLAGA